MKRTNAQEAIIVFTILMAMLAVAIAPSFPSIFVALYMVAGYFLPSEGAGNGQD